MFFSKKNHYQPAQTSISTNQRAGDRAFSFQRATLIPVQSGKHYTLQSIYTTLCAETSIVSIRGEAVYVTVGADAPTPRLKLSAKYYFFTTYTPPCQKLIHPQIQRTKVERQKKSFNPIPAIKHIILG